jgi:predicted RNase H-like HicB family nuclease
VKNRQQLYLQCSVLIRPEGNQYTSWCPELDIASSGATIEEARINLNDAINCFLQTYTELGELSQMLKERGIKLVKAEEPPTPVFLSETRISVSSSGNSEEALLVST